MSCTFAGVWSGGPAGSPASSSFRSTQFIDQLRQLWVGHVEDRQRARGLDGLDPEPAHHDGQAALVVVLITVPRKRINELGPGLIGKEPVDDVEPLGRVGEDSGLDTQAYGVAGARTGSPCIGVAQLTPAAREVNVSTARAGRPAPAQQRPWWSGRSPRHRGKRSPLETCS